MKILIQFFFVIIFLNSCSTKENKLDKQSYQEQKESLLDKEKRLPKEFLKVDGRYRRNFWGNLVYLGHIENTATICSYKEVRVKLLYFNKGVQVTNHEELLTETIAPRNLINFKAKYNTPKGTDSIFAYIMSATSLGDK